MIGADSIKRMVRWSKACRLIVISVLSFGQGALLISVTRSSMMNIYVDRNSDFEIPNRTMIIPDEDYQKISQVSAEARYRNSTQIRKHTSNAKFVVQLYNGKDCRLLTDSVTWLGRGMQGLVWKAVLEDGSRQQRDVTVKMVMPGDRSGPTQWKELYDAMIINSTETDLGKHFSVPMGTIRMPSNVTWDGVAFKNDILSISYMAPGNKLISEFPGGKIGQVEKRRQIVQHMVHMYRHMFDRGVLYCDMKTGMQHVLHSTSTGETTLIDFDNIRIYDTNSRDYKYYVQAHSYQLLSLIAMVCSGEITRKNAEFEVDTSALCHARPTNRISKEHESRLFSALNQCEFHSSPSWIADFERAEDILTSYDSLMKWCEIPS